MNFQTMAQTNVYQCKNCGYTLSAEEFTSKTGCPKCGSFKIRPSRML